MADLAKIVEDLSKLTVLEAAELSKLLEEKWGVSAAAPVAMAMPGAGGGAAAPAEAAEEQTEFTVVLLDGGDIRLHRKPSPLRPRGHSRRRLSMPRASKTGRGSLPGPFDECPEGRSVLT